MLQCPAGVFVPTKKGSPQAMPGHFTVSASDNCDPAPSVVCVPPSGNLLPNGVTTVTCTATDAAGNESVCTFEVIARHGEATLAASRDPANELPWPGGTTLSRETRGEAARARGRREMTCVEPALEPIRMPLAIPFLCLASLLPFRGEGEPDPSNPNPRIQARPGPGDGTVDAGVGVTPPETAVVLLASACPAVMRYEGGPERLEPRSEEDILRAVPYAEVGGGSGDLVSTTFFGDARLHVEWYAPPGGEGQRAANSGVYLQDRYEVQILGTPAGKEALEANEAGALYDVRAPDHNASTGPGTWQAYDIHFRAPRFDAGRKTADARLTLRWNGVLVQDDVAIAEPTGSRRAGGEDGTRGMQLGPLRLQDHASDAAGPVRFRNVWIEPLEAAHYTPGEWIDLLATEEDWVVRGGEAHFALENGVLVGESRPRTKNTFFTSRATYADFELTWEVRGHPELNSGLQIRSEVAGGLEERSGALVGYQVELDPSDRAWSGGLYDESRRGWLHPLHAAPEARKAYRPGEWNRFRVVAAGPILRTWINGVPATEVFDAMSASGHLAFQVHNVGDREEPLGLTWRNVRLRLLTRE